VSEGAGRPALKSRTLLASRIYMTIGIGMTTAGLIKSQTAFSLTNMLIKNRDLEFKMIFKEGPIIPMNREVIAEIAQQMGCSHLLFVDSDMVFPTDAVQKLLEHDKDIIGVNYNMRQLTPQSTVKTKPGETVSLKLSECAGVATGFMLVKMEVFEKVKKPWFHVGIDETDTTGKTLEGHDYRFCRLAREAGYTVWYDGTIGIGHIGDYVF